MHTAESTVLLPAEPIRIIDVGAAEYGDSVEVYGKLSESVPTQVFGFEPLFDEHDKLSTKYKDDAFRTYLPFAIGDGEEHTFNVCKLRGCSSFLEPNFSVASQYQSFADWMTVVEKRKVRTKRLDDLEQARGSDFIQLDVQGFELTVLRHATEVLRTVSVVQCEVEFVPQYIDQPLFSEIEKFLRSNGFMFHTFTGYGSRNWKPLLLDKNLLAPGNQWLWADAVFVKNTQMWAGFDGDRLVRFATLVGSLYQSHDLSVSILGKHDSIFGGNLVDRRLAELVSLDLNVSLAS